MPTEHGVGHLAGEPGVAEHDGCDGVLVPREREACGGHLVPEPARVAGHPARQLRGAQQDVKHLPAGGGETPDRVLLVGDIPAVH